MVNPPSQVDGHVLAIQDQEGQDSDEPPLRPPHGEKQGCDSANGTTSIVSIPSGSKCGWNGDPKTAHTFTATDVAGYLGVDPLTGLSNVESISRLERNGYNKLDGAGQVSIGEILLRQVSNSLTIVLVIAMALAYGTLDFIEGAVITAVILLNIILGFVQDFRAEKTMQSLLSLAAPSAEVTRNGALETIKAELLVVGDIVNLKNGAIVPADLRLCETVNLEIDEAILTGESHPATKYAHEVLATVDTTAGDKSNIAFSGTKVSRGRATGIVIATGMKREVGNIAEALKDKAAIQSSNRFVQFLKKIHFGIRKVLGLVGTPMQIALSTFAIFLFGLAVLLAIIVFSANKWQLSNEVVLYGICVAVAVIPESLIAVMTITLAVGVKAMAKGNVVVRNMASLEAIGGVTNICSDKTGTLTQGKMIAHKVWVPQFGILSVENTTRHLDPEDGDLRLNGEPCNKSELLKTSEAQQLHPILDAVSLCNLSTVRKVDGRMSEEQTFIATGDPTEIALQILSMRFGRGRESIIREQNLAPITEHEFDSSLKRMSVAFKDDESVQVFAKGASEAILPILDMSQKHQEEVTSVIEQLASEGLRVLCVATKSVPQVDEDQLLNRKFMESNLTLRGLVGLYDPPRIETLGAVIKCREAGIAVHMLTGDHLSTATAIAQKVGILQADFSISCVMKAQDFDALTNAQIDTLPSLPLVLARCSPTTKVRMVDALSRRKAYCVMTGDGVNDAPALKAAHVGIAMGINGTDVAKDAADMVLTDDNFASIVNAVEEGRRLFDNIQKFLMHLLISNIAQVILLLIALVFKDSDGNSVFPLSPLEILWANMITSSFLALGLGMEEAQADIMIRPPRDLQIGVFTRELITDKMLYGTWAGILCLASFTAVVYKNGNGSLGEDCNDGWNESCDVVFRGRAIVFAVLSFLLLVTAWEVKHFTRSLFNLDSERFNGKFSVFKALVYNRFLLWAVAAGFVITFPVIYIPVVNKTVFKHKGITWEWGIVIAALVLYLAFIESWKALKRRFGIFAAKRMPITEEQRAGVA